MASTSTQNRDDEDDTVYLKAYRRLPEQSATTIRFFDRNGDGESFILYNNDAQLAARDVFQTNAVIKRYGSGDKALEFLYMQRGHFENFVRDLLLIKQYRVEVYANEITGRKNGIEWVAKYKGSPGNLTQFEDLLFANNEMTVNNGVMGIRIATVERNKTIGIAHVNMNEGHIHLLEFIDNETLTNFESILVQLSPKEAVFPAMASQTDDLATLRKILERNGVLINERKSGDFDTKDIEQDLSRLLKLKKGEAQNVSAFPELEKTLATSGLAGVIRYLELLSGDTYIHQFTFKPFESGLYVKLDSSACRALHLTLNCLERNSRNDVTLLSVLDKCRTAQGHRLLAQYLKQPLLSKEKLEERLDLVQILVEDVVLRQSLFEDHLRRIPDCQVIARKLMKKKATLQDCYRAYLFLTKMQKLIQDLEEHESDRQHVLLSNFIEPLKSQYEDLSKFKQLMQETLDLELADRGEFMVRATFDENLQELRDEMDEVEKDMGDLLCKVANKLDLEANKSIRLEANNQHGHFFRVTLKDEKAIRNQKEFEIVFSKTGSLGFRNTRLESLSNEFITRRTKYEAEQKSIVDEVLHVSAEYHTCFELVGHILAELDVYTSFAVVSANSPTPYIRPKLLPKGTGRIIFNELRHPCVESQPNVNFIPNDLHFETGKQSFYIITGPNMGGKSTFLRSVGVATLLAHVGCFVPAAEAEVSIVDAILARVGASDSLIKGVSTFMAEMIETSFILKTATSDSLVIIDELGRGTSTYDGFGLCWAISEHIATKLNSFCVLATHFHELTALADQVPTVVNYHVTAAADENGLTMLYKIEKGPCDRSFGIHVATHVGFPSDVITEAKDMARVLEDFSAEDDQDDDEAAVKRRRDCKTAGQEIIDGFLEQVRTSYRKHMESKDNGLSEGEADSAFQKDVEGYLEEVRGKSRDNPYLLNLLQNAFPNGVNKD